MEADELTRALQSSPDSVIEHFAAGNIGVRMMLMQLVSEKLEGLGAFAFFFDLNELAKTGPQLWEYYIAHAFPSGNRDNPPDLGAFIEAVRHDGQLAVDRRSPFSLRATSSQRPQPSWREQQREDRRARNREFRKQARRHPEW